MKAKTERNQEIFRMAEEEGRTFTWIASKLGISDTMVRKVYHSQKAKQFFSNHADKFQTVSKEGKGE